MLTQYIGSILIALLAVQAASELVVTVARTGSWIFYHHQAQSVLERSPSSPFRWDTLILSGVRIALYLLTAYGLAEWLHPAPRPVPQDESQDGPSLEPTSRDEDEQS